jgi:hypothetical protein
VNLHKLLPFAKMNTISDVLDRLDTIINWARENNSPAGYFAVVYHQMTKSVQKGIADGVFDDGPRMERLDVVFAQRYFDAFDAWRANQQPTEAWQAAFDAIDKKPLSVLQHILLGINAHIDLDLGIAAAQIQPGPSIWEIEADFNRINQIIENLVDPVQDSLGNVFPLFRFFDWLLRRHDERIANRLIGLGRFGAWKVATSLAALDDQRQKEAIRYLDQGVALLANPIKRPGRFLTPTFQFVYWGELGTVQQKIDKIRPYISR